MTSKYNLPTALPFKKVLVFGDTHFDDVFNGQHVDYQQSTLEVMEQIINIYKKEKPDAVILAGDLIGVATGRSKIKSRQYLKSVVQFLTVLGGRNRTLYVVKGNHDYNVESDYNFLSGIGVFNAPEEGDDVLYLNPDPEKSPDNQLFIHLRNYNQENNLLMNPEEDSKEYHQAKSDGINVVVAHNDFFIKGQEEGYHNPDTAFELQAHSPFYGADIILSGHIHLPSLQTQTFKNPLGETVSFLNLGCPTRPSSSETYNKVWYTVLEFDEQDKTWDYTPKIMELKDFREEFVNSDDLVASMQKLAGDDLATDKERLEEVLSLLRSDNLMSEDSIRQIDLITVASQQERDLAKEYIRRAQENL